MMIMMILIIVIMIIILMMTIMLINVMMILMIASAGPTNFGLTASCDITKYYNSYHYRSRSLSASSSRCEYSCEPGSTWSMYGLVYSLGTWFGWLLYARARKRKVKPLRASKSLSETFPCTGHETFSLKGKALRGNRVTRIGMWAHYVHRLVINK